MDILAVRPELKDILGYTGKEAEFSALLKTMKVSELAALNHYLNTALEETSAQVHLKEGNIRRIENQIQVLKRDYKEIYSKIQLIQKELKNNFTTIFKNPKQAEENCVEWESVRGLIKTGWTLRNKPSAFGRLKGFSLLGVVNSLGRLKAKKTAHNLNYEQMKKTFNEGKKIATWLGHILKGV